LAARTARWRRPRQRLGRACARRTGPRAFVGVAGRNLREIAVASCLHGRRQRSSTEATREPRPVCGTTTARRGRFGCRRGARPPPRLGAANRWRGRPRGSGASYTARARRSRGTGRSRIRSPASRPSSCARTSNVLSDGTRSPRSIAPTSVRWRRATRASLSCERPVERRAALSRSPRSVAIRRCSPCHLGELELGMARDGSSDNCIRPQNTDWHLCVGGEAGSVPACRLSESMAAFVRASLSRGGDPSDENCDVDFERASANGRASSPSGLPAGWHDAKVGGEPTRRGGSVTAGEAGVRYLVVAGRRGAARRSGAAI
jgi:hypothetical protein